MRASQRERLVKAMLALVAEHGYQATTVPAVVAAARVSRNAFYEFFRHKEECFLEACEGAAADILSTMETFGVESDWVQGVRRGFKVYLRWWQDRPGLSLAFLVELPSVGANAYEKRERYFEAFEQMFTRLGKRIRRERPGLPPLKSYIPRMLVLSLNEILAAEVRDGRSNFSALEDAMVFFTVKLLADDAAAQTALKK